MAEDENEKLYDLSLSGDGISITRRVSEAIARNIIDLVMGGPALKPQREVGVAREARDNIRSAPTSRDRLSLREYLDEVGAARNPDKITSIGQYMLDHEGRDLFSRDDVKARFRTAGEPAPGNFHRDFAVAISTGWISEDPHSPGNFYVTKKGREVLEGKFVANIRRPTTRRRRRDGTEVDEGESE